MFARTSGQKASAADISTKWGWFVALGIAMIALGIAAWLDVITVTIAGTIFVGASLLIGGVLQIIHAFMTKEWRGFILNLFCGILYIGGGLLIMNEPVQGALFLTLLLMAALGMRSCDRNVRQQHHVHASSATCCPRTAIRSGFNSLSHPSVPMARVCT